MEVLFISHKYPPATGGMEKFSYELIQGIRQKTKVYTILYEGGESRVVWFYKLKSRVEKLLTEHPNISIIHLNDGLMTYFALWLKRTYKIPVVATFHGLDIVFPLPYFQKKILPRFNQLDAVACVSEATKQAAIKRGIHPDKIIVINNGVDHAISKMADDIDIQNRLKSNFGIGQDKKILITLGRSVKRKGFSWFVENVLPNLDDDYIFVQCGPSANYDSIKWRKYFPNKWLSYLELMLGLPTDEAKLKVYAKSNPKFVKTGYLKFDEVIQFLKLAHVFVMPNIKVEGDMEGFGLVALEASMANCIVLASRTDGITNAIIDNANGYLVTTENAEHWVVKINEVFKDTDISVKAEEFKNYTLEHYSWDKMCGEYYEWFRKEVNNRV